MEESNPALAREVQQRQIQQNDPVAIAHFFACHYATVFNRCLRMLGHRQDAEDATQETFSRAVRYIHRWDPRRPLEPWLITIAGNRCRTQLSRRRTVVSLSDTDSGDVSGLATSRHSANHAVQQAVRQEQQQRAADALREEVELAITNLPDKQCAAFKLFHEQGFDYEQIADQLGCPIGTAKTWVHRARTSLMKQLSARQVVSSDAPPTSQDHGKSIRGKRNPHARSQR